MIIREGCGGFLFGMLWGLDSRALVQYFPSSKFLFSVWFSIFFLWGRFLGLGYGDLLAVFGDDGFLFCCNSKPITRKNLDL